MTPNNREIKFRAWTGIEMEYRVVVGNLGAFYASGIDPTDSACIGTTTLYHKETPVMQYTGLKDKNGVEIYEGDIVVTNNNGEDGNDVWKSEDWGYQEVTIDTHGVNLGCFSWDDPDSVDNIKYIEIIGNIHQNGDLLNEKTHR